MKWFRFWPRRESQIPNGHQASVEKHRAEKRLVHQRERWPEIRQASDRFAAMVERAMRGQM